VFRSGEYGGQSSALGLWVSLSHNECTAFLTRHHIFCCSQTVSREKRIFLQLSPPFYKNGLSLPVGASCGIRFQRVASVPQQSRSGTGPIETAFLRVLFSRYKIIYKKCKISSGLSRGGPSWFSVVSGFCEVVCCLLHLWNCSKICRRTVYDHVNPGTR